MDGGLNLLAKNNHSVKLSRPKKDLRIRYLLIGYAQAVHPENIGHSGDWLKSTYPSPTCAFINFAYFLHFTDI